MAVSAPRKEPKARYHKGLSKEDILDAALAILHEEGSLDGLTLARVAKRLGVSAPAVYHHLENRDALFAATAALGFRHLTKLYEEVDRDQSDLNAWIRARGRVYLEFAFDEPALHQLMYRYRFENRHAYSELIEAEDACFGSSVARIDDGGGRRPRFRSHQTVRDYPVSMTIWAAFHGLATIIADGHLRVGDRKLIEKLAADVADVLTHRRRIGLLPVDD